MISKMAIGPLKREGRVGMTECKMLEFILTRTIWRFSDAARNLMELTHSDQSEVVPEVKPVASSQGWKHMIVAITCIVTYSPCFTT